MRYGKVRSDEPPSVLKNVLAQEPIPSTSTGHDVKKSVRPTKIASSAMRSVKNDELDLFLYNNTDSYSDLCQQLIPSTRTFLAPIVTFMVGTVIFLQSILYFNGVPAFLVKIFDNLKYETFHKGVKCYVKTLSSNRINILNSWSKLEETYSYICTSYPVFIKLISFNSRLVLKLLKGLEISFVILIYNYKSI